MSRFGPDGKRKDIFSAEFRESQRQKKAQRERDRQEAIKNYSGPPPEPVSEEVLRRREFLIERDAQVAREWEERVKAGTMTTYGAPSITGNFNTYRA